MDPGGAIRTVRLGDVWVAYFEQGSGDRRLTLIHGLGQDHAMWAEVQAGLSNYTSLAYDIRGHGGTSLGAADGTVAQLGRDLVALQEFAGRSVCIGFSLGGVIALWAAAERPDLVEGVVAVATSSVVGKAAAAGMAERIDVFERGDADEVRAAILGDTRAQLGNPEVDPVPVAEARLVAIGDRSGYVNGARAVCSMRTEPVHARLGEIGAPVLIVSGERDMWCPRRAAELMLEQLKNASFVELPGVGHLVSDDAPQQLTQVIRRWLETEISHD